MDDIVNRLRSENRMAMAPLHMSDAAAEIEALRDLCRRMAALLDDCRPHDATLMWVMGRIDVIEEWQSRRPS